MTEIALIEDNPNDVELTKIALRKAGIDLNVHVFRDGAMAIDALLPTNTSVLNHLRLIFLDLKLPRLNGFEVLQQLRNDERFNTIPVVILTSSAVESDQRKAYSLGANSYIVKPIDYLEHSKAVTQAVRYWTEINSTP